MASNDLVIQKLLENNVKWAQGIVHADPGFFIRSAAGQTPQVSLYLFLISASTDVDFRFSLRRVPRMKLLIVHPLFV